MRREPVAVSNRIFEFVGAHPADRAVAACEVRQLASLGRWRQQRPELISAPEQEAGAGLRQFGYLAHG
jgi:hypothetical protein